MTHSVPPNSALVTDDYVLVSVTGETTPCPTMSPCPANSPCGRQTPMPTATPTATSTPKGTPANFTTVFRFSAHLISETRAAAKKLSIFPRASPYNILTEYNFFPVRRKSALARRLRGRALHSFVWLV